MKHHFIKYFMVATAIALTLSSCQDDEINHLNANDVNKQSLSDSDTSFKNVFSFRFKQPKVSLTKGLDIDQRDKDIVDIETGIAYFAENPNKTYETMKVIRQSDPSKYFYIMLTNLDIPYPFEVYLKDTTQVITSECGPYANDYSYLKDYGLLYTKSGADHIKDYIYMKLPLVRNGKEVPNKKRTIRGRLMNHIDIADLFETDVYNSEFVDSVGQEQIDAVYDSLEYGYYNAFVFGLDEKFRDSDAYHSLGGFRDIYNVNYPDEIKYIREQWPKFPDYALKQIYTKDCANITHTGEYWMATDFQGFRRRLSIYRNEWMFDDHRWTASYQYVSIPNLPNRDYGYSVRLVFDPFN